MQKIITSVILITVLLVQFKTFAQNLPEPPTITSVSIEPSAQNPGAVRIYWIPSTDTRVTGYNLYRFISDDSHNGFFLIDSIGKSEDTYLDTGAKADLVSERYYMDSYILKGDSVGNPSDEHRTLFFREVVYDSCKMTNTLTWSSYVGWGSGAYYNLLDGNGDIIMNGLSDTVYTHKVEGGTNYIYSVRAINRGNQPFKSTSNRVSRYATPLTKPDPAQFYVKKILFDGSNANFLVNIDTAADLEGHSLMVSQKLSGGYVQAQFNDTLNYPTLSFSDASPNKPRYYKVNAIGVCADTVAATGVVRPILLRAATDGTGVTLNWNSSFVQPAGETYRLTVSVDGAAPTGLNPPAGLQASYEFADLDAENAAELFCFEVQATDANNYTSISNTACVSREAKIDFPTAFSPNGDGLNDSFGPFYEAGDRDSYIKNAIVTEFKIVVYDKFGGAIFIADNPSDFWGGDINGKYVTDGGYIYYLWFKTSQGRTYERSGTINVVYP